MRFDILDRLRLAHECDGETGPLLAKAQSNNPLLTVQYLPQFWPPVTFDALFQNEATCRKSKTCFAGVDNCSKY